MTDQSGNWGRFRNPMDAESIRQRVVLDHSNPVYRLAVHAAGHQSAYTVDRLSSKLEAVLPGLIAGLAAEVERENAITTSVSRRTASISAMPNPAHAERQVENPRAGFWTRERQVQQGRGGGMEH